MAAEKIIEQKLVRAVKLMGGLAPKFVSPGFNGVPDRIVLLPGAKLAFVELKADGKKMRPLQVKRKRQLEALGFSVYCVCSTEQIGGVLNLSRAKLSHLMDSETWMNANKAIELGFADDILTDPKKADDVPAYAWLLYPLKEERSKGCTGTGRGKNQDRVHNLLFPDGCPRLA